MKRLLGLGIVATGLAGCQMNRNPSDPFLRTTVPPPATGQVAAPPADPYYTPGTQVSPGTLSPPPAYATPPGGAPPAAYNPPPQSFGAPPSSGAPQSFGAPPDGGQPISPPPTTPPGKYQPQGGFNFQQTSIDRGKAVDPPGKIARGVASTAAQIAPIPRSPVSGHTAAQTAASQSVPSQGDTSGKAQLAAADAQIGQATDNSAAAPASDGSRVVQASYTVPVAAEQSAVADATGSGGTGSGQDATAGAGAATVRILDSQTAIADTAADSSQTASNGATASAAQPVQEITDLPSSSSTDAPRMYGAPRSRLVFSRSSQGSAVAGVGTPASGPIVHSVERPASGPGPVYGVEGNYQTLRGRLEYSQSARQWKLRYVPIDGQTDQYGGSVLLPNSTALQNFHPGDFVVASGQVISGGPGKGTFSPQYDMGQIAPQ